MEFFNTLTRKKEVFSPINKDLIGMYTCGPTVYNYAHIGNLRTFIFEDILKRVLLYNGYKVKHIMNITDVGHLTSDSDEGEDKIEKEARKENKAPWAIAQFYTEAFFKDCKKLNFIPPNIICKATEHIKEMIELIQKIEANGYTYFRNGNLYFDVSKYKDYRKLAGLDLEKQIAGIKGEVDKNKKNPCDFILWFTQSKFKNHTMVWDSPWGKGYPGWHIECSAMAVKYLGEHFDIHCGGIDLIPVHHTNEIAQTEAAINKTPWVNYWLHGEFLILDKTKMAKSTGEFITLKTLEEKGISPLDYRFFCLNAHYRNPLSFSWEALRSSKNGFNRLKEKYLIIKKNLNDNKKNLFEVKKYEEKFKSAINNDLNIPQALAIMWQVINSLNLSNLEKYDLINNFDKVFGLSLEAIREEIPLTYEEIALIKEREQARKEKNWVKADKIRSLLLEKHGIKLMDTKKESIWKKLQQ